MLNPIATHPLNLNFDDKKRRKRNLNIRQVEVRAIESPYLCTIPDYLYNGFRVKYQRYIIAYRKKEQTLPVNSDAKKDDRVVTLNKRKNMMDFVKMYKKWYKRKEMVKPKALKSWEKRIIIKMEERKHNLFIKKTNRQSPHQ